VDGTEAGLNARAAWQHLATLPGGTVAGLATSSDGRHVLAATPAGIRRSTDRGRTWSIAGLTSPVPFANLVCAAPEGDVAYAGGRQGTYRSADGGETWTHVLSGGNVLALAVPSRDTVFVGTDADGILRSDDGGRTWAGANPGLLDLTILALVLSPNFASDRLAFAATASGVYRTRNEGRSWRAVDLGSDEIAVQALAMDDSLVLAGTETDGVFRSTDQGASWERVDALAGQGVTALAFGPHGAIAAATERGVALSDGRGAGWQVHSEALGPVLCLTYLGDGTLLAGLASDGIARSEDGGRTWTVASDLRARLLVGLTASKGVLVAGDLQRGLVISRDGGRAWQTIEDAGVHAVARSATETLFAASERGLLRSTDHGATWIEVDGVPSVPPRALAASGAVVVAWPDQSLSLSEDDGRTWRTLPSPGADFVSLALSPSGALYAATSEVVVWRLYERADAAWQRWFVRPGPTDVVPLAATDAEPLVGLAGRVWRPMRSAEEVRGSERRPMWQSAVLGDGSPRVTALVHFGSDVVVGTSGGVFASRDAGDHFAPLSEGLSPPAVVSLAYPEADELYALGLGGTVWRHSAR
jgi:hypothetical protein